MVLLLRILFAIPILYNVSSNVLQIPLILFFILNQQRRQGEICLTITIPKRTHIYTQERKNTYSCLK